MELETQAAGRTVEGYAYGLVGKLPAYIQGDRELKSGTALSDEQRMQHSDSVIGFNHELRAMIDHYQGLTPVDIRQLLLTAYVALYRNEWGEDIETRERELEPVIRSIDNRIYAMWGEINGQMIVSAAGFGCDDRVSNRDERHGIDLRVCMDPSRGNPGWIGIDFKSSSWSADEAASRARPGGYYPIWTQLTRYDFKTCGSFRISPALAAQKAPAMRQLLLDAYEREQRRIKDQRNAKK